MISDEETDPVRHWEKEVSQLYDFARSNPGKSQGGLLAVSEEMAARFLAEVGVDASGYSHLLDADGLRHIHKQHGGSSEIARGQVPIVKQDILNLRSVMIDPDTIAMSPMSRRGLIRIEITKEVAGHILYYVLEVRPGRRKLAPVTLYKRKKKS